MRIYYRGPDAIVTGEVFAGRDTAEPYAIRDLRNVRISCPAGVAIWWLRPRTRRLHAKYRGVEVILYASSNERVFNQVARALRRALEDARPPTAWTDNAVA